MRMRDGWMEGEPREVIRRRCKDRKRRSKKIRVHTRMCRMQVSNE